MPIPTGAIGDLQLPAIITLRLIPAQRRRAAFDDMSDHPRLLVAQAIAALICAPMLAEDIGDIPPWARGGDVYDGFQ
jgi:hypothetical protein